MDCTIFLSALLFLSTVNISSGVCDADWFGPSCQYKCHCANNQCDVDGKCTGGSTCVRGWFGPLCQYQDLTTVQTGTTTTNSILTDGNDATCSRVQTFNVSWDISYEVTWLRVVLNGSDSPQNLQVNIKSSRGSIVACAGQTPIRVYAQVTDIFCSNNITSSQVFIDFKANKNVCSVYISGGRNLALNQPTWQSTNYSDEKGTFYSTKAVDGDTNSDFYAGSSCSHTKADLPGSWMVNFTQPRLLNRYVIYNRDSIQERLKGFNLTSYSSNNKQLFTFKDTSSNNVPVYYLTTATSSTPVSYVTISVGGILTLCEVETYGEYYCTSKTFGLECVNTCNCKDPTETCFVATGGCRSGCPTGYEGDGCAEACSSSHYGPNCTQTCSSKCLNQQCNNVNGSCSSCVSGYKGTFCEQDCDATYYGPNCTHKCSSNCRDQLCNKSNGNCYNCYVGKQGALCDRDCNATYYGQNCTQRCSNNCTNQLCNNFNGSCNSCLPGKKGSFCDQDCEAKYYGQNCAERCSTNCTNQLCNKVNGICNSCIIGKQGRLCDQDCTATYHGQNCTQRCSTNCTNQLCNNVDGTCNSCVPGKQGDFCDEDCDIHHYGENCRYNCSTNCTDSTCNRTNGECFSCIRGFQGALCDRECNDTSFGDSCNQTCSTNCLDQLCDNINGSCFSCIDGKMGEYCDLDCDVGKYGQKCNSNCSVNCTQSQCNATNGHCFKCSLGYQGDFCDQVCDDGYYGDGCINTCSAFCMVNATESRCNNKDGVCLIGCNEGFTRKNEECSLFFHALPVDQETPIAAIVAPILAVLIIAVLCIVGFLLWRRRRSNQGKSKDTSSTDGKLTTMSESEMVTLNGDGVKLPDTKRFSKPVAVVNAYCNTLEFNDREILVSQLHEFMQTHNIQYFGEEFYKIPSPQNVSSLIGLGVANKNKNRYKNICTYDHSRVHLEINTNKNEGDYINASYIEGYNNEEKFIASQGPNEASINDFVRMLWEQKVDKVVMLANLIEEGKEKCSRYWPTEGSIKFGDIKVKLATTHAFADYTLRKLELSKKNQTSHQFTQFHFTSWPDKGVPLTPWGLVDFEQRVALGSTSRPIVVHCSAGVGRTGTFIALRNVMREAEDTGRINCFQTVAKLRQDRMLMVQTAEQYQFLHKAAQVAIVCMGTTVSSNDIVDRIQKLSELSLMKRSNMEEEFHAVSVLSEDFSTVKEDNDTNCEESVYQNNVSENVTKNRYPSIVPSTPHRAVLSCESRDLDNYINAVLVPSFTKRENQILTQLPMPNTVTDFWRLVAQYNVKLIVAFQTLNQDQTLGQYLPANMTTHLDCGPYEIHTGPVKSESLWEEQQITVKVVKKSAIFLPSNVISETHVTHIASKSTDLNPKNLLKLLKHTRSNNVQAQGRVLYMCRNGAEYSGLACVLSLLLDRMDHDQSLTVPLVVGAIKCIRPQVIPSLEQYRCLYKVLERHNEVNTPYNNFANYSSAKPNHYVTPPTVEENIYANS